MPMNLNPYLMLFAGGVIVKDELLTHLGIKISREVSLLLALTDGHQQSMLVMIESGPHLSGMLSVPQRNPSFHYYASLFQKQYSVIIV